MKTLQPDATTYTEHPADIIDAAVGLIQRKRRFALITSLAIEGGAAREVGSLALVEQDGAMTGYLSNGCIDRDIYLRAQVALSDNKREVIRYGDGSRFIDLKLPCGGALNVLIDPNPDVDQLLRAKEMLDARVPATLRFVGDGAGRSDVRVHAFTYAPRVRLYLAGRGAIFRSMAQLGSATGYEIYLLSPDQEDLGAVGHLARSAPIHLTSTNQELDLGFLDSQTAFLTLFHDHDWEPNLLLRVLSTRVGYIGALGSRRTHMTRCETLKRMGASEQSIARLNGPIGLVGSLRDASFIAVSALAEVVATFPSHLVQAEAPLAVCAQ